MKKRRYGFILSKGKKYFRGAMFDSKTGLIYYKDKIPNDEIAGSWQNAVKVFKSGLSEKLKIKPKK